MLMVGEGEEEFPRGNIYQVHQNVAKNFTRSATTIKSLGILILLFQKTHPSVCPSIHPYTNTSVQPPIHMSIHPIIHSSIYPSVYPCNHPSGNSLNCLLFHTISYNGAYILTSIRPSIPSIYQSVLFNCISITPSIHPSVHLYITLSTYPSVIPSINPSIQLSIII